MPVRLEVDLLDEPPSAVASAAYFAASEALTNIVKHADAHEVAVRAVVRGDMLHLEISDDGRGCADARLGTGLRGADRVATVGGTVRATSPAGGGTRIEVELPCA